MNLILHCVNNVFPLIDKTRNLSTKQFQLEGQDRNLLPQPFPLIGKTKNNFLKQFKLENQSINLFYKDISRTSAVSSTNFGSILIFASCVSINL